MKTYRATREGTVLVVKVDGKELNPRIDLWNHSPSGFECGYAGSGPAQLALAILADYLRDDRTAVEFHQAFKFAVIAKIQGSGWTLVGKEIDQALCACTIP